MIVKARTFTKEYKEFDDTATKAYVANKEKNQIISEAALFDIKAAKQNDTENLIQHQINESVDLDNRCNLRSRLQLHMLKETLGTILYESLPLDESYKSEYTNTIKNIIVNECMDIYGSYNKMKKSVKSNSIWLESLFDGIDRIVESAEEAKLKDGNVANIEDLDSYDDCKVLKGQLDKEIDIDEVNKIIKDKIVNVVKDEQDNAAKRQEMADSIASELAPVAESSYTMSEDHSTLFKSIAIKMSKQALNESTDNELVLDNELITAETILEYTLLETLNTLKVYKFTIAQVMDIANNNIHSI